jgi:hypothetical protein
MTETDATADVYSMTPEQATAKLAELEVAHRGPDPSADPKTAAEARARLDRLTADAKWAAKLEAGDTETRKEFQRLTELVANAGNERLDAVLAGKTEPTLIETTTSDDPLTSAQLRSAITDFAGLGFGEKAIREVITGTPFSREQVIEATGRRARAMGTAEWVTKYLAGDPIAVRDMTVWNSILAASAEDDAA